MDSKREPDSSWFSNIYKSDLFLPVFLLILYLGFFLSIRGKLPTGEELIAIFGDLYAKYGYTILVVSAFLESLFLINLFVPGQVSMALGIIFTKTGHMQFAGVIPSIVVGALCAYVVDYLLGKYGLSNLFKKYKIVDKHISESVRHTSNLSHKSLALSFIHSNLAAFISFGCGVMKYNFLKFFLFALTFTIIFTSMWAVLIYLFSDVILEIIKKYIYIAVILVVGYTLWNSRRRK